MSSSISIQNLNKWYGGTHALRDVSIDFQPGEVHAVAGENGAGKSTLVKILAGILPSNAYEGEMTINDVPVRFDTIRDAEACGIFLVPQELNIVPRLSVAEFLFLNREPRFFGVVDQARLWSETQRWIRTFGIDVSPLVQMGELSSHEQQLVSIARAMTQGVSVLILDEPTASLTSRETELLFDHIRRFRADSVTTLYISHRLSEFEMIADAVTVMRNGEVVDRFQMTQENDIPSRVIQSMVGGEIDDLFPDRSHSLGAPIFQVSEWSVAGFNPDKRPLVEPIDFRVSAGEVLGVFGLIGSGVSDLARSLFGGHAGVVRGSMQVDGRTINARSTPDVIKAGVAYIPGDRQRDGLALNMSTASNMSLVALSRMTRIGLIDRGAELAMAQRYGESLGIKYASLEQEIGDLSGGNQQKVVIGKWLLAEPRVIILEEPTRGIDVGARVEIYRVINELSAAGRAVIIISTDLTEVVGMSDRMLIMNQGRLAGQWLREEITEQDAMLYATTEETDW